MNIYLISQSENNNYDTYDSAVVIAESEDKAKIMHPSGKMDWDGKSAYYSWADSSNVAVKLIGNANDDEESAIICASFNAG